MAMIKLDPKKTPPPAPAKDEDEDTNTYEGLSLVGEIDGRKLFDHPPDDRTTQATPSTVARAGLSVARSAPAFRDSSGTHVASEKTKTPD